ncbi:hypothetical protein AVEN_191042-1 [Araneus ventricosus]|uniref:Uncharacterized protein n=1 Tax=Araneus ventricosus TaxID=182803 RepID=A0A4Y2AZE3_ARAVE|nr:hypothetical protein AVEN_191042-1 [Araneus ventricosus]
MCFDAFLQNIPKVLNRIYVWASRWPIHDREVRGMLIEPGSSQLEPVRSAVILVKCSISMWMTVQHKWMEETTHTTLSNSTHRIVLREVGTSPKYPKKLK